MAPDLTLLCAKEFTGSVSRVTPLLPVVRMSLQETVRLNIGAPGWVAPVDLATHLFTTRPQASEWTLPHLISEMATSGRNWRWSSGLVETGEPEPLRAGQPPAITTRSRVLAVVPHYGCEQWLDQCLYSLTSQTRPPDNIVVIDDGSAEPPRAIVQRFPEVTLLATPANVGPENILSDAIQTMDYDAFMVQDADDWSSEDRLECSLREAERTGAEMVGAEEVRIRISPPEILLQAHPPEVNLAMANQVAHYVCHGSSLIARSLALRIGGLDCTLQVLADTDFSMRAAYAGRVVNLRGFHYYRRLRAGSRTSHPETGFGSALRNDEKAIVYQRARRNAEALRNGIAPEVMAPKKSGAIGFRHLLGPPLAMAPRQNPCAV
jgi:hypothetical protein